MNKKQSYDRRLLASILALIGTMLSLMAFAALDGTMMVWLGAPLLIGAAIYFFIDFALRTDLEENRALQATARLLSVLIFGLLAVSTYMAIQSLWVELSDPIRNRFVLENTATGTSFAAIVLILFLSTLQKDVYWFTKRKPGTLDERQIQERRAVFETSYKYATVLVIIAAYSIANNLDAIPRVMELNKFSYGVPGHIGWPIYNVVIALFAIPLSVAAWRKR
jgi:hypothetical protein